MTTILLQPSAHTCYTQGGYFSFLAPYHGSSNKSLGLRVPCVTSKLPLSTPTRPEVCYSVFKENNHVAHTVGLPGLVPPPPSFTDLHPMKQMHSVGFKKWDVPMRSKSHNLLLYLKMISHLSCVQYLYLHFGWRTIKTNWSHILANSLPKWS